MNYIKYKRHLTYLSSVLWALIDLILPARCPQTGDIVPSVGTLSPRAWAALQFIAAPYCACCGMPFPIHDTTEVNQNNLLCSPCLASPPSYHKARSVLVYDEASRSL
ncbi:MAG: double zinc ribbon domain-containing protein, partial [Pseudomonadota bacterium]